jgi:anaerobic magnesium-protoporphyrin IX monomethyl ester cyclase
VVTLVRPPHLTAALNVASVLAPPLAVASLAASLRRDGHRVAVVDAVGEAIEQRTPMADHRFLVVGLTPDQVAAAIPADSDVVGVSTSFSHDWPLVREVVQAIRERLPDALVVAGGEHATAMPDHCLADCPALDVVVLGEGEETLCDLIDALGTRPFEQVPGLAWRDAHLVRRSEPRSRMVALDDLPTPAWDLVPFESYLDAGVGIGMHRGRTYPILATRGCPYRCTFCSSPQMWTTRYSVRSPANVLAEITAAIEQYDIDNVDFYDLTMIIRRSWIVEFCDLAIASGEPFSFQLPSGTRTEQIDAEVCRLLAAAGCSSFTCAPESGSAAMLERIGKRVDLDHMLATVAAANTEGISCTANIIMGFPEETRHDLAATFGYVVQLALAGAETCTIAPFSPYPGSREYELLRGQGRIGPPDDAYFLGLAYADLAPADSWTDEVGPRELWAWRWATFLAFYTVAYGRRPSRLARSLVTTFSDRSARSRLEQAAQDFRRRTVRRLTGRARSGHQGAQRSEGITAPLRRDRLHEDLVGPAGREERHPPGALGFVTRDDHGVDHPV